MLDSVRGFFKAAKNFLLPGQKRKQDQRDASDYFLSEPSSKRSRLNWSSGKENHETFDLFPGIYDRFPMSRSGPSDTSPKVIKASTATAYRTQKEPIVYDISDDEDPDDDDVIVETVIIRQPRVLPAKKHELIDLETPDRQRPMFCSRTPPPRGRLSFGSASRYSWSDPQRKQRSGLFHRPSAGSSLWSSPVTRNGVGVKQTYEKAIADLELLSRFSPSVNAAATRSSDVFQSSAAASVTRTTSNLMDNLLPTASSADADKPTSPCKCSVASSEVVSVSETSGSNSPSSPPLESQSPPMKNATSLERLNSFHERSPLVELNERFGQLDPILVQSKLSQRADIKARRNATIERLTAEAQLRRDARLALQKPLEDELRLRMRLEGLILEEKEVPEEEEFVELTDDQYDFIDQVMGAGPSGEVLVKGYDTELRRHDLRTLLGANWLNDEVINFFFQMIMARGGKDGFPKVYSTNTFFYGKIVESGQSSVKRWTRKLDLFSYDMMLVPVHLGNHWCLAVVDFRKKLIQYYDSLGGSNGRGLEALFQYLQDEHLEKKKTPLDITGWRLVQMNDIPHQENGSDCGMFACRFAEYASRDARINFSQVHMPYFRSRTIYEILTKQLL